MSAAFDPYEVLGVERDADDAAVKRAYRRRARTLHPDANGSAEAFAEATRARDTLLDPARRARFDATGAADDEADNTLAQATEMLITCVSARLRSYVHNGFSPALDPGRSDMVAIIRADIAASIRATREQLDVGRRHIAALRRTKERFRRRTRGKVNFISRALESEAAQHERQIAEAERHILVQEEAMRLLADFDFHFDAGGVSPSPAFNQATFFIADPGRTTT